jgi:hypothetical protein
MPFYFSAHTTACLTKQAIRQLMKDLLSTPEVKVRRCVASQLAGRMITEVEAPDQATLEKFFAARFINCQWVMRIDLDAHDGSVTEF